MYEIRDTESMSTNLSKTALIRRSENENMV